MKKPACDDGNRAAWCAARSVCAPPLGVRDTKPAFALAGSDGNDAEPSKS